MKTTKTVVTTLFTATIRKTVLTGAGLLLTCLCLPNTQADTQWNTGAVGFWAGAGNWNNGVPGSPDINARMRNGGTANVTIGTPAPNGATGVVDIRIGDNANASGLNIVNWNMSGTFFAERFRLADHDDGGNPAGASIFNHTGGTIRTDTDWYHIARRGYATYNMSGNARVNADDRLGLAEGANNHQTEGYLIMNGSSQFTGVNRAVVARSATSAGTIIMNDSSRMIHAGFEEIGRSGSGTLIMNDTSYMSTTSPTQVGIENTGRGDITMNGGSRWDGQQFGFSIWNSNGGAATRNSESTLTMNDNSRLTANSWFELGGGQATFTLNGTSQADLNGNTRIGMRSVTATPPGDGITRMILNENSKVLADGGDFWIGVEDGSRGMIQVNGDAQLRRNEYLGISHRGRGTLEINDNGAVTIGQWVAIGQQNNGDAQGGTVNLNGGSLTIGGDLQVGERKNGVVNVTGGELTVANSVFLARDQTNLATADSGIVNQSGGTVSIGGQLHLERASNGTGQGTYNLTGGTLRVNTIDYGAVTQGDFNWTTGGTLTMLENNVGQSGIGGGGLGGAGAGTTITVNTQGQALTTGDGAVLDLGDLYQNFGNNFDTLAVTGDLTLSGVGDVLDFWDNVNLIRPGGNSTATGEFQLISVTGTLTGQFDNIIGPEALGQFFQFYQTGATGVPLGTSADTLRRNTGYVDYRADGLYFVYKVGGQIPEPHTTAFLFLGVALLRGFTVMKRNKRARDSFAA